MSQSAIIFVVVGALCAATIFGSIFTIYLWSLFDCAMSDEHEKKTKRLWLILLFFGNAILIPHFVYGLTITTSPRLRRATRFAIAASLVSLLIIIGATLIGRNLQGNAATVTGPPVNATVQSNEH